MSRLAGKTALVVGAGSGIGRAVAVRLAEEGAAVVIASRTEEHLQATAVAVAAAGGVVPAKVVMDVTDEASVRAGVTEAVRVLRHIDVLSNNAGVELSHAPALEDTADEEWQQLLDVNLTGMFRVCRAALPSVRRGGSIVNMGSINSVVAWPNNAPYSATKGAVLQFTRALALELAERGIRANCVCPGIIDTPLTGAFLKQARDPDALRQEYADVAPLRRMGTAREVANCVAFLASDEASFVTGSALFVDGGTTAR